MRGGPVGWTKRASASSSSSSSLLLLVAIALLFLSNSARTATGALSVLHGSVTDIGSMDRWMLDRFDLDL